MATTVNNAFYEFMQNTVNLNPVQTTIARSSRDNLLSNINDFSGDSDFFLINISRCLNYGSFARHTKLRPLDDIDLMICISSSEDRKYTDCGNGTFYMDANSNDIRNGLNTIGTRYLNSTKVINRFISKLSNLYDYRNAEMHKNHEAATLKLKSYDWNFDIVPCFWCAGDFYIIPDGYGNWKKTNPQIDNVRVSRINVKHNGNLLPLVRLIKYWNNRNITYTISSYMLECMILNRYDEISMEGQWYIDLEYRDTIDYLSTAIFKVVYDPKGIQGNLNTLTYYEKIRINEALREAYNKSVIASEYELRDRNHEKAINKWREVFGYNFPQYTGE